MAKKPGSLVSLQCEACPRSFTYRLTTSPFRKKFCPSCAETRTYENKKSFDTKRKQSDYESAKERSEQRKVLRKVEDREMNPAKLIDMAMRVA